MPNGVTGARRVSYWSDKSGATTQWTAPAAETVRATTFGSGGGRIGTLLTDLPTALTAGTPASTGGLTAAANGSTSTATMWTLLLRPTGDTTPPANQPPTAVIKRTCAGLTCTFDATDSTDPDDGISEWAWEFGDGGTSEESVVEHTYDVADTYTATLTVTDDTGDTDDATQTFTLGTAPHLRHRSASSGRRRATPTAPRSRCRSRPTSRPATPCSCSPRRAARRPSPGSARAGPRSAAWSTAR